MGKNNIKKYFESQVADEDIAEFITKAPLETVEQVMLAVILKDLQKIKKHLGIK